MPVDSSQRKPWNTGLKVDDRGVKSQVAELLSGSASLPPGPLVLRNPTMHMQPPDTSVEIRAFAHPQPGCRGNFCGWRMQPHGTPFAIGAFGHLQPDHGGLA